MQGPCMDGAAWTNIWAQSMSGLLGSLTPAVRELIDGLASDCHDDSTPEYLNIYVVLASCLTAGIDSDVRERYTV
jgi:hypothetical protein